MTTLSSFTGASVELANPNSLPTGKPDFSQSYGQGGVRKIVLGTLLAQVSIVPQDVTNVTLLAYDCDDEMQRELSSGTVFANGELVVSGKFPYKAGSSRNTGWSNGNFSIGRITGGVTMINGQIVSGGYSAGGDVLIIDGREIDLERGMKLVLLVPSSVDLAVREAIGAVGIAGHIDGALDFFPHHPVNLYGHSVAKLAGDISGSGDVELEAVYGDATMTVSGDGKFFLGRAGGAVEAKVTGNGACIVNSGTSRSLTAKVTGNGKIKHRGVVSGPADLKITGNGNILVGQVNGEVDRKITGSGKIEVNGQVYRPKWH